MEQHEKEMLEKIRQHSENIEIPESLRPENVERKLEARKYKKRRKVYAGVLAAAGCAAMLGIMILYGSINLRRIQEKQMNKSPVVEDALKEPEIRTAKSYGDIYEYVKANEIRYGSKNGIIGGFFEMLNGGKRNDTAMQESSENESKGTASDIAGGAYSHTNTREEAVDEADIAKTDGRYIYSVTEEMNAIGIVDTEGERLEKVAELVLDDCDYINEIYVKDDRLIVLYQGIYRGGADAAKYMDQMKTAVYDLSDLSNPKRINEFMQSGAYYTSRLNGDYLYVFSKYYIHGECKKSHPEEYVPYVDDIIQPFRKILLPDRGYASTYIVVTSINVKSPDKILDTISVLSGTSECYVSAENIYVCDRVYDGREVNTSIRKIAYENGKMEGMAKTEVIGYLNDSFSIDEYKGYLRMVVSLEKPDTNSVYILDKNLELTGKIQGLAKDERVYSARFMGDTGYFVTFRETDPLFSVDLSNPKNPKIIGRLKIPGFSEYLHPYGDGLLLGIGKEVDDRTVTMDEVKLSMFDVSDPSNVKEIDKCIIKKAYDSPTFYSYKSVTINAEKNVIGFSVYAEHAKYYLYEYVKDKGFTCNMEEGMPNGYPESRGIYIGNIFYLVKGSRIESYNLETFKKIDDIIL